MRKLGASLIGQRPESPEDQIRALHDVGFDCFFTGYYNDEPLESWANLAASLDLEYASIHCHYRQVNTLWEKSGEGDDYLEFLKTRVDGCTRAGVPLLVMHATRFTNPPPISQVGLDRFRRLNDYAQSHGVAMAYENVENPEYLQAVLNVTDSFHGFCWDCGHNYCYSPWIDLMALYGHRLKCLHLHDNYGLRTPGLVHHRDDLHLLPFSGGLLWEETARRIAESGYQGPLTLEMSCKASETERNMPLSEYLALAHSRVCRLRGMVDQVQIL